MKKESTSFFSRKGWPAFLLVAAVSIAPPIRGNPDVRPGQAGEREPLRMIFLANMGVLVSSGDQKVLIDGLFDNPNPVYRAPSPEVPGQLLKGVPPYDGVDLVLVTHNHPDHFAAGPAARFLEATPGAGMLAPADAAADLQKAASDWEKIKSRIVFLDLKVGDKDRRTVNGIAVTAFRTLHSGNRESPMNIMYIVELNGRRVFHEGDSPGKVDEFRGFGLEKGPLDLAVIHFWMPTRPEWADYLQKEFIADHLALGHFRIDAEKGAPGVLDQIRKYYRDIFLLLPGTPEKIFR